jgi:hypothetical protein
VIVLGLSYACPRSFDHFRKPLADRWRIGEKTNVLNKCAIEFWAKKIPSDTEEFGARRPIVEEPLAWSADSEYQGAV